MTDHDMRIRLAEAQGWTDIMVPGPRPRMGEDVTGMPPEGHRPGYCTELPDPLENDRDAAMLRAWCVGQGWSIETRHTCGPSMVSIICHPGHDEYFCIVADTEEPDPCRRERMALCRAVLQALEVGGVA